MQDNTLAELRRELYNRPTTSLQLTYDNDTAWTPGPSPNSTGAASMPPNPLLPLPQLPKRLPPQMSGRELAYLREQARLTQDDLAPYLGLAGKSAVSRWESREKLGVAETHLVRSLFYGKLYCDYFLTCQLTDGNT